MKIAFYTENGLAQIILTPEEKSEEAILATLAKFDGKIIVKTGQFYLGRDNLVHSAAAGYSQAPDSTYLYLRKAETTE